MKETLVLGKSEDKLIRQQVIHRPTENITLTVDIDRVSTRHPSDRSSKWIPNVFSLRQERIFKTVFGCADNYSHNGE